VANIPDQTPVWAPIPLIEKSDPVLGGMDGAANRQAIAMAHRLAWVQQTLTSLGATASSAAEAAAEAASQAGTAAFDAFTAQQVADAAGAAAASATSVAGSAHNAAIAAQSAASSADSKATSAQTAASTADTKATAAQATASAADTKATTAQTTATSADTKATSAQTMATAADAAASAATTAVAAKATRIDLGNVTITYSAVLAVGAGARSIEATCTGARIGDAIFVAPTASVPDGYAVGAGQCLVADKIRVSVVHPALVLGANFSIPLRVFALR